MTYPLQELAIIGPVLFIVLMIAFPVIGIFSGWKRAAYWGGGNLLFYAIGLIIWALAHDAIAGMVNSLITPLLAGTGIQADITKIAASVAAPVFFLIILLVGNIILVINYYAWFKRVAKIGKFEKREIEKKKRKPRSFQYKIVNGAIGGVGLPLLLLPTTFSFTQAVMMTTTSVNTRANNQLASNLYNGLMGVSKSVNWFSYYGYTNTFEDIDALFAAITVATKQVTYIDVDGNPQAGTSVDAITNIVGTGVTKVIDNTVNLDDPDSVKPVVENIVTSWNDLLDGGAAARSDLTVMFNSENATELVEQIIGQKMTTKTTVEPSMVEDGGPFGLDGTFDQVYDWYVKLPEDQQVAPIEMTQASYDNMNNMIINMFNLDKLDIAEQLIFENRISSLVDMFFVVK